MLTRTRLFVAVAILIAFAVAVWPGRSFAGPGTASGKALPEGEFRVATFSMW